MRLPGLDLVRVRDVALASAGDPQVLAWAAREDRLLLTHDVNTMTGHANSRLRDGHRMAGLVVVPQWVPIGAAVADLEVLLTCSPPEELADRVTYLPL